MRRYRLAKFIKGAPMEGGGGINLASRSTKTGALLLLRLLLGMSAGNLLLGMISPGGSATAGGRTTATRSITRPPMRLGAESFLANRRSSAGAFPPSPFPFPFWWGRFRFGTFGGSCEQLLAVTLSSMGEFSSARRSV